MQKRNHDFARVAEFKQRFRDLTVAELEQKQAIGSLQKEAATAIRELLREKHQVDVPGDRSWEEIVAGQRNVCRNVGVEYLAAPPELKLGIAVSTIDVEPLNALRHLPVGDTSGWYVWGGEELSEDPQFFQPLHIAHVLDLCPQLLPYLGLPAGWRVLLAPHQKEVWFDSSIVVE
jgi:hypothetical protein